ncbi:carboxypeptidase-like regulatory domain-containing protein [Salmonirosea aquatica]|uniref:carboxypeptidase-like regulatory domain-containing protein n=1 Tax=Salmonirosea aquatica TaxID=2654236 RepID=UPI0035715A1E
MRLLLFTSFFLLSFLAGQAQIIEQGQVSGRIIDAGTQQPLPFAAVTVWTKTGADSSLAGGTQSDEAGNFTISHLPLVSLLVRASFVGYLPIQQTTVLSARQSTVDLGTLTLRTDATLLNEVKVKGEKDPLAMSTEKRVFNVAKNLTSIGGTAESLLRNVPAITLDENGNPSLRNMATTLYINGKPTQLTLAQIPANQIESVEVISNPSARYDASTSGGIVNLVLKKNRQPGYNGIASVSLGQNRRYDATANLDWRQGRWNVTALYSLNATQNPLTGYVHRTNRSADSGVPTGYFDQNTAIDLNNHFQNGRLAIDYNVNAHNLLTVGGTVAAGAYNSVSDQQYTYRDAAGNRTGSGSRHIDPQNNFTNLGVPWIGNIVLPAKRKN